MRLFIALIKKEFWENKSIWILPFLLFLLFLLTISHNHQNITQILFPANVSFYSTPYTEQANLQINQIFTLVALTTGMLTFIITSTQAMFYAFNCLFTERKDNSLLFWKSLPISDHMIIFSKWVVCLYLLSLPFVIGLLSSFFFLLFHWSELHATGLLLFNTIVLLSKLQLIIIAISFSFTAWYLFVSAVAPRNPMTLGIVIPVILLISIRLLLGSEAAMLVMNYTVAVVHMGTQIIFNEVYQYMSTVNEFHLPANHMLTFKDFFLQKTLLGHGLIGAGLTYVTILARKKSID